MILDDLVAATTKRIAASKQHISLAQMAQLATKVPAPNPERVYTALGGPELAIIAEVKAASPSKGQIATAFNPVATAQAYAAAGANAISVLTEPTYFHGDIQYLRDIRAAVDMPLLRKDFTIDPYMIYEARAAGANLILLIVAILTDRQLHDYLELAQQLGLAAIVEAHDAAEIKRALAANARIIGVNNRDLRDFSVDLHHSANLRPLVPQNVLFIAESGIKTPADTAELRAAGVNAVLIGETLMRAPDKQAAITALRGGNANG
ncbi:indole-3-glycerol phosphate synthase TrpC [Lacticaseibacillus sharpeae]|uniref:Indole-3-glycerol phosphate synthase n=1 Tax=Lacticaseibacillus sharpeae JCM 1186 = DSM 20505 TaxID=1291052 RepID=A0A0R1ZLB2_9LACO|nr:indole-3-glycerol phosphate synthase TrpC [Lacticaseibacillus sharpeae]KRM55792.1 indole-3-glycerol-phosphate synthase [Lacticaseibacillus sharpeae JCM 1186 = DSM 20505]